MFKLVHFASDHFNKITVWSWKKPEIQGKKNFVFSFYVSCDVSSSKQYRNLGINQLIEMLIIVYMSHLKVILMQW